MPSSSAASVSSASAWSAAGGAAPATGSPLPGLRRGSEAGASTSLYIRWLADGGTRTGSVITSVRIWWQAATSARWTSDSRQRDSNVLRWSASRVSLRYSATVLGSEMSSGVPSGTGACSRRRRVTFLIRSMSCLASLLSATFRPRERAWSGSRVSSM
jgi:hypothetical protein